MSSKRANRNAARATTGQLAVRLISSALSAMLLLSAPVAQAKPKDNTTESWDKWKSLSSGYVGRRKVPAKFDLPKSERQFDSVQEKVTKKGKGKKSATNTSFATIAADGFESLWLYTESEGLHGVSIADLAGQLGVAEGDVRKNAKRGKLTLTNTGAPVAWYFDADNDRILFVAEKYDTLNASQNAYHFSAVGGDQAQRMGKSGKKRINNSGAETPFNDSLHFEEEPDFLYSLATVKSYPDVDYWFWDYLFGGFKDVIEVNLDVPNPAPSGLAQLRVKMWGWTDAQVGNEHHVYAELNGEAVGSVVTWDAFEEAILVADFDQSLLSPSGNNTLTLRNVYDDGTHPGQWLDDIEVNYSRLPTATDGQLWLHNAVAGTQAVTGFGSESISVIQSLNGKQSMHSAKISPDNVGGYSVTFAATGGADYIITETSAIASILADGDIPSDLTNNNNSADYLIIAPREFAGTAQSFADYRFTSFGATKIAWLDDIYDEFNDGRVDPFAITRFMNSVQQNWLVTPSAVILIGKGTADHKDRMGYGDSFLPPVFTDTPWELAASDDRLLGGNGDAPFAIGRLPITNDDEGIAYVNKVIAYESLVPGVERYQAVLVADNPDNAGDFHANSDLLATRLTDTLGFDGVTKLYHPDDSVRTNLILNATWEDNGYISYDGHGATAQVGNGREDFLTAADAEVLTNSTLPVFTALTCSAGNYTRVGFRSLASAIVLNPNGGAIASVVPTGLSLDRDAQELGNALVDSLYGSNNTIGGAVQTAKAETAGSTYSFMQRIYSVVGDPVIYGR